MPELPEVETIRMGLGQLLPGRTIKSVDVDANSAKSFPNASALVRKYLVGAKIIDIERRAKVLIIGLDNDYCLIIHLKMTGQLVFVGASAKTGANKSTDSAETDRWGGGHPTDSLIGALPDRSTRVTVTFTDGSHLYFNDQRKFGWIRLIPKAELPDIDFFRRVGPEPLIGTDFTWPYFRAAIGRRRNTSIKAAILDQSVVAGVGNIYADESLFATRIHPATKAGQVSPAKLKRLWQAIPEVLALAIANGGSTYKNYIDAQGGRGQYLMKYGKVFRREGQACPECGGVIEKIRVAGRGTHFCPACQKLPPAKSVSKPKPKQ